MDTGLRERNAPEPRAIRGIWPLPDDDQELADELQSLKEAASAIAGQLDELRSRAAELSEKYLVRHRDRQRPGFKVKLRWDGQAKEATLPDDKVLR